jgi:hypothetical protein
MSRSLDALYDNEFKHRKKTLTIGVIIVWLEPPALYAI